MTDTTTVTIDDLEALASQMETDVGAERARLHRLITAYARIIAAREPDRYETMPLEYSDVDGHWDNSFPPRTEYKDYRGPRLIEVCDTATTDIATSGGFYHAWRRETTDRGLYVGANGVLYGCEETGTGEVGQFAAHPGDTGVMCSLEWGPLTEDDIPTERMVAAEAQLRDLAFPLLARAQ